MSAETQDQAPVTEPRMHVGTRFKLNDELFVARVKVEYDPRRCETCGGSRYLNVEGRSLKVPCPHCDDEGYQNFRRFVPVARAVRVHSIRIDIWLGPNGACVNVKYGTDPELNFYKEEVEADLYTDEVGALEVAMVLAKECRASWEKRLAEDRYGTLRETFRYAPAL